MGGPLLEDELKRVPETYRKKFIETGTYKAETAMLASRYFDSVHTIELDHNLAFKAKEVTSLFDNITVYEGHSVTILQMIKNLYNDGGVTFFIDAHGGYQDDSKLEVLPVPILQEVEVILSALKGKCVFIIDDISQCYNPDNKDFYRCISNVDVESIMAKFPPGTTTHCVDNDRLWIWYHAVPSGGTSESV